MGVTELIYLIVLLAVGYFTRPKPTKPRPAALEEFELPTPDEGTPQCVIFGDCWTADWQVLSYGNLRVSPIRTSSGK